jgi:hypothetical protein
MVVNITYDKAYDKIIFVSFFRKKVNLFDSVSLMSIILHESVEITYKFIVQINNLYFIFTQKSYQTGTRI